ncbi:MAG: hypothetical protein FJ088_00550 [Deltaproteobacteria bacterium]|nr:hypothetical protein [Deltaproteobacteria bacterium]
MNKNPKPPWNGENGAFITHFDHRFWIVLCTLSRQEKKVACICHETGIPFFLPLCGSAKRRNGSKTARTLPLFPGYLFGALTHEERLAMLQSGRVFKVLSVPNEHTLLRDLGRIKQAMNGDVPLSPHLVPLKGQRVVIKEGPLAGLEGIVEKTKGKAKLS